ncbi:MAG: hypothetical protein BMS9Abin37_2115 [Acidobacteriota bacterium]|nr:MAG: hypothetical protein BMS9Abin37_2115 [Acidobacteriota bacterium]
MRVIACQRFQQQRRVVHRVSQRPDLVQRRGERHESVARYAAVGGFESGDAAQARGLADRSAGVGSEGRRDESSGDGGCGAAARSAGNTIEIPRVFRRMKRRVFGRGSHGELVHVGFAQDDCAGVVEALDDRRVIDGYVVLENARATGASAPGDRDDVFERDRKAVERAALGRGQFVELAGALERGLRHPVEKRFDLRVECFDAIDERAGRFLGGEIPALGPGGNLGG